MCTKAVSTSIKTGGRSDVIWNDTVFDMFISDLRADTQDGNVGINALLEEARRIQRLACNIRVVCLKVIK